MPRPGKSKDPPVSWSSLPHKSQLVLLTMARLSEPLTMSSLRSYMFYQLKSFDQSLPDSTISYQAGLLASAFTGAQFLTAVAWGRVSDSEHWGRKRTLLVGLVGTGISALGFGFSSTFAQAMTFRIIGGMLNGNVGVMRTMVGEMVKEKKYQSRAFMILPMTANIGTIIGPMIGGLLADPINSYPSIFGKNSFFGGEDGVQWMIRYPYAFPNLISAIFLTMSALAVILGLEETHYMLRDRHDWGLKLGRWLKGIILRRGRPQYTRIPVEDPYSPFAADVELQDSPTTSIRPAHERPKRKPTLPFRRIFTRNVIVTLFSRGLLAMHIGTFANLWYIFLSTPRAVNDIRKNSLFHFTGGLGLPPSRVGLVLSVIGVIGILVQILVYPPLATKWGTTKSYRYSLLLFPPAYLLAPFLAILPSATAIPLPASGIVIWAGLLGVLFIHVLGRTFAMPSSTILVNNCCPHPSVLSTVHGVAQSVSSGMRMLGPMFGGWGYGLSLQAGVVGIAFWVLMCIASLGAVVGLAVFEGDGHEIKLDGEEEPDGEGDDDDDTEKLVAERLDIEIEESNAERRTGSGRAVTVPWAQRRS